MPTEQQVSEALHGSHDGLRGLRSDRHDNCLKLFKIARDWAFAASAGEAVSCRVVIAQKMGYAVTEQADADRIWWSIARYARQLQRAGVLRMHELENARGAAIGIRFELLDGWPAYTHASCASSSAGCSVGITQRQKRRFYAEHRFEPRRIAGGRGGTPLYFFGRAYRCRKRPSPTGTSKQLPTQAHAHESATATGGRDAIERACPPSHRAALVAWRERLIESSTPEPLRAAAHQGELAAVPAALAAWSWRFEGREPRFSRQASAQLERSAAQLDRLWGRGAGAGLVVDLIVGSEGVDFTTVASSKTLSDVLAGGRRPAGRPVASLAFFVHGLRVVARQVKRKRRGRAVPKEWRPRHDGGYWRWEG